VPVFFSAITLGLHIREATQWLSTNCIKELGR